MISLFYKSILNRKFSFSLTVLSIALSISLFIGVERLRLGLEKSFSNTISQTDLVVGARGSSLQLLLYTVFHIGNATNNISMSSYENIAKKNNVAWTIPFSFGDSYHGFRVVATNENFYKYYHFLGDQKPEIQEGQARQELFDVVIGQDIAQKEHLSLGQKIILAHGISSQTLFQHQQSPFTIVGILKKTGTPLDRSLFITLEGMEAIHFDWSEGAPPLPGQKKNNSLTKDKIKINQITSFLLGATSRIEALSLQREIDNEKSEPLMAVIPGVALSQLWQTLHTVQMALVVVTLAVVIVGLLGMMVSIFNTLEARRREIAILRALGVRVTTLFFLLMFESFLITLFGCILGVCLCYFTIYITKPIMLNYFGINIVLISMQFHEYIYLLLILVFSCCLGIVPAYQAYKNSLADGLSLRI